MEDIESTQNVTEEQRKAIGQNLIDFCEDFTIVLGATEDEADEDGVPDGEAEEVAEDEREEDDNEENRGINILFHTITLTLKELYCNSIHANSNTVLQ